MKEANYLYISFPGVRITPFQKAVNARANGDHNLIEGARSTYYLSSL